MKNLFDIQGQVVVITGGTGVLGREIGEYLALQGAKVVLMGRNEETGKQIVGGIRGKGGEATASGMRRGRAATSWSS